MCLQTYYLILRFPLFHFFLFSNDKSPSVYLMRDKSTVLNDTKIHYVCSPNNFPRQKISLKIIEIKKINLQDLINVIKNNMISQETRCNRISATSGDNTNECPTWIDERYIENARTSVLIGNEGITWTKDSLFAHKRVACRRRSPTRTFYELVPPLAGRL